MTTVAPFPAAPDWSTGTYETTAEQLRPAAAVLVDRAAPEPGETVVDIGCGTGAATLLSALRGAHVVGVDPARRLLQVARDAAAHQGLDATFRHGEAGALPVGDGEADVVLSSFGLIFANDPAAAAAEIARVRAPRGRVVFTAWAPGNAHDRAFTSMVGALTSALAEHGVPAPSRFAWHDPDALRTLFARIGLSARLEQHELQMTGESVSAYFEECIATHPLWVTATPLLAEVGKSRAVRAQIIETLTHANEDPSAFRITSRYFVVSLDRIPPARQLRDAMGDIVSLPGEEAYEDGRQAWNLAVDQRPAAVATPADAEEVRRLVLAAGHAGLRVAPQSTGHGARDGVILDDAVLLRTDRLDHVLVDAASRRARVGAGARWGAVSDAAEPHRLAALAGSSRDVGVAGYTLGGGIGWLARRHGLACNAVASIELVTPGGRLLRADPTNEPELFWALRGGGGDLGVVTELELELFDVSELVAGALFWPLEQAGPVLGAWADWTCDLPDELTSVGRLLRVPAAPEVPEPLRGQAFVVVELAFLGTPKDADTLLAALRELDPVIDTVGEVSPAALGWLHMDPEGPVPAADDGVLLTGLTDETIDALLEAAGAHVDSPLLSVEIRHLEGAAGRTAPGAGASALIPAPYAVFAVGPTPDETTDASVKTHLRRVRTALEPWSSAVGYLHFTADRATCFAPDVAARLTDIKAQWDAGNLIASNEPRPPETPLAPSPSAT